MQPFVHIVSYFSPTFRFRNSYFSPTFYTTIFSWDICFYRCRFKIRWCDTALTTHPAPVASSLTHPSSTTRRRKQWMKYWASGNIPDHSTSVVVDLRFIRTQFWGFVVILIWFIICLYISSGLLRWEVTDVTSVRHLTIKKITATRTSILGQ